MQVKENNAFVCNGLVVNTSLHQDCKLKTVNNFFKVGKSMTGDRSQNKDE
jgi:hypothetical protein